MPLTATRLTRRAVAAAACALLTAPLLVGTAATTAQAADAPDWLHTEGNQIVDAQGNPVWLTGANWFGFNAGERVFHGLWSANITEVTASMADRGINIVRVPISTQLLLEWKNGQAAVPAGVNTWANPELTGMTTLEVFDHFVDLAEQNGLKVMLDVHSAEADNSGHIYPVWYEGAITPEVFYSTWEWFADRYKDDDTIVAYDLKNEPHGQPGEALRAKWDGSTDVDNWKHTAQTAARRILAINPNALILVEGIEVYPKAGQTWSSPKVDASNVGNFHNYWWGGNLRGVADHPVDLGSQQDQLVYSPHDYGPLVFEQPWFAGAFDKASLTRDVWGPNWLYIHDQEIAPLLVGEWGGRLGQDARQDRWMVALRDLMIEKQIHHTFWVLNPNSGDTGGLLLDDWKTWDEQKYAMLEPALWQHEGRFVGLDHDVPLGGVGSTTGISLGDRYGDGGGGDGDDTTAPTAPTGLTATATTSESVTLTWTASTDAGGVAGYDVHQGTTTVASSTTTTATVSGLAADTLHSFTVRARDRAGNVSAASTALSVRTSPASTPTGGLAVQYRDADGDAANNAVRPSLRIANTGTSALDLSTVSARYWFTRDGGPTTFTAACDWAVVGCGNVRLRVVPLSTPVDGADAYLEVTFTAGSVAPGATTGDIQVRFHKSDWSAFDETDDHSRAAGTSYAPNAAITGYRGSTLAWGTAPV